MKQDNRKPQHQQGKKPITKKALTVVEKKDNFNLFILLAFCFPVLLYIHTIGYKFTYFDDDRLSSIIFHS